jgi:YVTN family beta-propeller protein
MKRSVAVTAGLMAILLYFTTSAFAGSVVTIPVGTVPKFVAVNQTTNRVYVSNLVSNTVSVIDGDANTVIATVAVGTAPEVLDVNSITNMVYVANLQGNSVSVIDGSSNGVVATITGMSSPFGVAVNAITNQVFVSSTNSNNVSVIDGATNMIVATVPVGNLPVGVRVNSATNLIYVANETSGTISVIDGSNDTIANTFILPQAARPGIIALDPITNHLFVTDGFNLLVYVLDASSGALLKTLTGGKVPFKSPVYVAMFQPGKTVLISDDSTLSPVIQVNESSYAATGGLKGGTGPIGIAINRKTGKIYVAESGNGTVNVYSQ